MAYLNENLTIVNGLATVKGTDIATSGTLADLNLSASTFVRLTAATQLTSILAGASGRQLTIVNANTVALLVKNKTGTAANQIALAAGADLSLPAGCAISLIYDDGASLWRQTQYVPAAATNTIVQGGNAFGATVTIGATDANNVAINANNATVLAVNQPTSTGADVSVTGTGAVKISSGTTTQRPSSGVTGMVRYNSSTSAYEAYNGTAFQSLSYSPGPYLGAQNSTAIPAGYVGEEKTAFFNTNAYTYGSYTVAQPLSIVLTAGIWDVSAQVSILLNGTTLNTAAVLAIGLFPAAANNTGYVADPRNGANSQQASAIAYWPTAHTSHIRPTRVVCDGTNITMGDGSFTASTTLYLQTQFFYYSGTNPQLNAFMKAIRIN